MSNIIKPKRGTTDPAPGVLAEGEIGINTSAATAFVGVAGGGSKKLNAGNSETTDAVNSSGEATANRNRHIWFSDADDEKKRAYNDNFQYNPSTNTISSNIGGTSSNVTGVVDFEHGGTGRTNRDSSYSALMSGGTYAGNLNDCKNCGHYLISTSNANCPLQGETYGWMHVYTKDRDSVNVLQEVTGLSTQTKWVRTYNASTWTDWKEIRTADDLWKQESKSIPFGADLNTYQQNGIYVSTSSSNQIKNLPLYFGSEGAFTLVVTGITTTTAYTTQILYSISDPPNMYIRNQYNWQVPWKWTNWHRLIDEEQSSIVSVVSINSEKRSVEPGIKMNRMRTGGNKYTRFYEADDDNAQLAIAQSLPGSGSEGITRLNYNGSYTSLRGDVPLYLGETFAPIARFYFSDYGSSLPSAGNKGRVFFKKV